MNFVYPTKILKTKNKDGNPVFRTKEDQKLRRLPDLQQIRSPLAIQATLLGNKYLRKAMLKLVMHHTILTGSYIFFKFQIRKQK